MVLTMSNELAWTEDTVCVCDPCGSPMIPNVSTMDEEGCAWSCTTYGCPDFTGDEIETEDLEALGVPTWIADRFAALSSAYLLKELE